MAQNDAHLQISIFGATRLRRPQTGQVTDVPVKGVKPRQILSMLAARPGEPLSKEVLAERLWDGRPPRSYLATLESYVCVLRRQLGSVSGSQGLLATASRGYVLDPSRVVVDADLFRSEAESALDAGPAGIVAGTTRALRHVGGRLLASEPYAPWADEERRCLDALLVRVCLKAADAAQSGGDHDTAVELADRVLQVDPLIEAAWLTRMRGLTASSRRLEALRCYAAMESVLQDELGVEPPPEAQALHMALIEAGAPSGADAGQEVRTLLQLLRRTLERVPGLDVPREDADLSAVAARLIYAA